MKLKKVIALMTTVALSVGMLTGCGSDSSAPAASDDAKTEETAPADDAAAEDDGEDAGEEVAAADRIVPDEIVEMDAWFSVPGTEINDDNEIQQIIAEKTGVKVKETWLAGQSAEEAVGTIIAGGDYPDFINGGDGMKQLYEADALVAWDDYIDKYPNIKEFYSDREWDEFRQDDGHIYWMNPFDNIYGEDKTTTHSAEAFWIQVKVLEWAGYPKIETLDEYFQLLEDYYAANPTMEDGTPIIPYTILCEDWRYFCLENAGQFLDGYPNDGSVMVDMNTKKIMDYNTSETSKRYFKKLNEELKKGIVDPASFTQTYDEYIAKLSTGAVLGMVDQWWDFAYTINDIFKTQGLDVAGCNYVPVPITIEKGMQNQWHSTGSQLNVASGIAITKDCENVDLAFQFIDDLLSQEIHDLRYWGVEGVDYNVDENGMYERTEEQRMQCADTNYKASHLCTYSYFPLWYGTSRDGKNAMQPTEQVSEFQLGLSEPVVKCFEAYGATNYVEMLHSVDNFGPWYPMWSYSNIISTDTAGGMAWTKMGEVKHEWLPQVVMADDFDATWDKYMEVYNSCNPQDFLDEMQVELDRRIEVAAKYGE